MKISSWLSPADLEAQVQALGPWFYPFDFGNGVRTGVEGDPDLLAIHRSRREAIFSFLDRHFQNRWPEVSCLDLACHEGWFAFQVAERGARAVRGVDIRPERVARANFVRNAGVFANVRFDVTDLFRLNPAIDGSHQLVLFLGIFYHLEDPVRGLRAARALTQELCVIEGQVARHQGHVSTAWGKKEEMRSGPVCVVIDADPEHARPGTHLCLVPSLEALQRMVRAAGFARSELLQPTASMHEQYANFDRVILFAFP